MSIKVMKFGGTSVGNTDRIKMSLKLFQKELMLVIKK